jgi:1-acyl-sn-glycerol-3-phosphate acyltransferase
MNRPLKCLFFLLIVRPIVLIIGLRIHHRQRLPTNGPAIVIANHNSHLDTLVLMSLFPLAQLHQVRPVADEQYFLQQNPLLAWFSRQVIDIIPVARPQTIIQEMGETIGDRAPHACCGHRTFLKNCDIALSQNQIMILYPEGTRGTPEHLTPLSTGIAHLAKHHPQVPIVPVFLQGLGKVLPKGTCLLVPFLCHVVIGESLHWTGNKSDLLTQLTQHLHALSTETYIPIWK